MSENNTEFHVDTDEILKELEAEGNVIEGREPETQEEPIQAEPQQEEDVVEETQEPEVPSQTTEDDEVEVIDRVPKEPTLIPAWKAKIAEERLKRENEELRQQVEAYQANPTKENKQAIQDSADDVLELASNLGLELDDKQAQFFKAIMGTKNAVPEDLVKDIQAFQQQKQIDYLNDQFNQEFTTDVLPLVKEKYGELSETQLTALRQKLHDTAFTETYAKVPLKKVFRAEMDEFDIKPPKHPILTSKSGKTRNTELDLSNVDEETFANLDGDQIDAFVQQKAGNNPWSRR